LRTIAEDSVVGDIGSEKSISVDVIEFETSRTTERVLSGVGSGRSCIVVLSHEVIGGFKVGQVGAIVFVDRNSVVRGVTHEECGGCSVERHS